jgi:hypothetical protein
MMPQEEVYEWTPGDDVFWYAAGTDENNNVIVYRVADMGRSVVGIFRDWTEVREE